MKKRLVPTFDLAFEDPSDSTGFLVWQVTNLWQRKMKICLDPLGLTHVQFLLLNALATLNKTSTTAITQMMVANHANCDKMMTSKVLRTLEDRKFIMRKPHHMDTRSRSLLITPRGMELIEKATPVFKAAEEEFFKSLKSKQKSVDKRMKKVIKINRKALKSLADEAGAQTGDE
ncbi:MAG: hypothetical protein RLZZ543_1924 [Bacteroidota bacterium]|jgi:DNA-binding MarR family transcriptional regulator